MSCCAGGAGLPPLTSPHPHAAPASPSGPAGGQVGGMRIHVPHAVAHRAGLAVRAVAPAPVLAIAAALGGAREAAPEFQDRAERRCAVRIGHQGRAGDQIRRRQAGNVGAVRYSVRYVDALHFAFSSKIFTLPHLCT